MSFQLYKNLIYLNNLKSSLNIALIQNVRFISATKKIELDIKDKSKIPREQMDKYFETIDGTFRRKPKLEKIEEYLDSVETFRPPRPNPKYQIPPAIKYSYDLDLDKFQKEKLKFIESHPLEMKKTGTYDIEKYVHILSKNTIYKYNSDYLDISLTGISYLIKKMFSRAKIIDQQYVKEREDILGPDLAIAHFIVSRGGAVKTLNNTDFIRKQMGRPYYEEIPCNYDPSFKVEAVDASGVELLYEGINNFNNLKYLKWLSFKGNKYFDSWYLDRLTYLTPNIEYLDLSYCNKLNHYSLGCLYRFRNLQTLNLEGVVNYEEFKLACLIYESENPRITIEGIVQKRKRRSVFN